MGEARERVDAWRQRAREDPDAFWAAAADELPWTRRWDTVLDWKPPTFRWFLGCTTIAYEGGLDHPSAETFTGGAASRQVHDLRAVAALDRREPATTRGWEGLPAAGRVT